MTGNIGEWSEVYALFKLLADGKLYKGDENHNLISDNFFPILEVRRGFGNEEIVFAIKQQREIEILFQAEKQVKQQNEFASFAKVLFDVLGQKSKEKSSAFGIVEIQTILDELKVANLKAKSSSKSDIKVKIEDPQVASQYTLGFSIKSQLGSPSTLLNASGATNFCYEITGCELSTDAVIFINNIASSSKIQDRIAEINKAGGSLTYRICQNQIFEQNLVLVDSGMPKLIAALLLIYFSGEGKSSRLSDLAEQLSVLNPLGYAQAYGHDFYNFKLKKFLVEVALGLMPAKVWDGKYDTTGGFLVVKKNGDLISYHIYNKNEFENYLLTNTKLETPSSSKHSFGTIYLSSDGKLMFNLNLQIRFIQ